MTKKFENYEVEEVRFINQFGESVEGIYIHEISDEFGNGDGVIADVEIPETEQDLEEVLQNEYLETDCSVLESVKEREAAVMKKFYSVTYRAWGAESSYTKWFDSREEAKRFAEDRDFNDGVVTHCFRKAESIAEVEAIISDQNAYSF